jgi:hypothetical protein
MYGLSEINLKCSKKNDGDGEIKRQKDKYYSVLQVVQQK